MAAPPFPTHLFELLDKHSARRFSEVPIRFARAGSGAPETRKIRVAHLSKACSPFVELK